MHPNDRRYERERDRDRRDRRDRDRRGDWRRDTRRDNRCCRGGGSFLRRGIAVFGVGAALALVLGLTTNSGPKRPPAPERLDRVSTSRLTEHVTDNSIVAVALAAEHFVSAQNPELATQHVSTPTAQVTVTRGGSEGIRLEGVRSRDAHLTEAAARGDAVEQAREQITRQLLLLDPPVTHGPTAKRVADEYLHADRVRVVRPPDDLKAAWVAAKLDPNRVWVEVDADVSPEQLRDLRGADRARGLAPYAGGAVALMLAFAAFFRLDAWTKGHLTAAIGIGVAALVALATLLAVVG
jgi:hypothetical protein